MKNATKRYVDQNEGKPKINVSKTLTLAPEQIQEAIRQKAYELYEQRGCQPGNETEDWLNAERFVLQDFKAAKI